MVVQLRPEESPATKQDPYVAMMGITSAEAAGEEGAERCPDQQRCPHTTGGDDRHPSHQRSQSMVMDGPADSPEVRIW